MIERLKTNFNQLQYGKNYGNKYIGFHIYTLVRPYKLRAHICGVTQDFEYSLSGCAEMEEWFHQKRIEIGKALRLIDEEKLKNVH